MEHRKCAHPKPADFRGLQIADLRPSGLTSASSAEITVPPG